jgi:hypothetical protein
MYFMRFIISGGQLEEVSLCQARDIAHFVFAVLYIALIEACFHVIYDMPVFRRGAFFHPSRGLLLIY